MPWMKSLLWRVLNQQRRPVIKILQWNCNGLRPKLARLRLFLTRESIDCAFIQETHLNATHEIDLGPDYFVHRTDRASHKGGVISIFNWRSFNRVYRVRVNLPRGVEGQSWMLMPTSTKPLFVHNWYNPPLKNGSNTNFSLTCIQPYMKSRSLLLGDFNARSPWWGYAATDYVGRTIQSFVKENSLTFLNVDRQPTFMRFQTTPDLSIATKDLAPFLTWHCCEDLGSDHKTIILTLDPRPSTSQLRTRVVPKEASSSIIISIRRRLHRMMKGTKKKRKTIVNRRYMAIFFKVLIRIRKLLKQK